MQLKGYEEIIPGYVYKGSDAEQAKEFLLINRYRMPTETEVFNYIKNNVVDSENDIGKLIGVNPKFALLMYKVVPIQIREGIKQNEIDVLGFVKNKIHVKDQPIEEAASWFRVEYGLIPEIVIEKNKENLTDEGFYKWAFHDDDLKENDFGGLFELQLSLKDGYFIPRSEMDILTKHNSTKSNALSISGKFEYNKASEIINVLYSSFTDQDILNIRDTTNNALEKTALEALFGIKSHFDKIKAQRMPNLG